MEAEPTIWEKFLGVVEPHLPDYLHWNEICVSRNVSKCYVDDCLHSTVSIFVSFSGRLSLI